jgi:histidinol dehydrogenase
MKVIIVNNVQTFAKPTYASYDTKRVQLIVNQVRNRGDTALRSFEKKFNGVNVKTFLVSKKEIQDAYRLVTKEQLDAIRLAKTKLEKTESAIKKQLKNITIKAEGTIIEKSFIPLDSVGCYVPGGLARYPSSAIMSIVPAKTAGVKNIIVVTPPNKQGKIDPVVLVAADICGANRIFKVGGAHAIAALAFGTKSIPQMDKIVGPGGSFVTAAKSLVANITSIDMLAGPTELAIIADDSANPKLVALDLISQSEHSTDTSCYLITTSKTLANKVIDIIKKRVPSLKRKDIVESSLKKNGAVFVCKKISDVISIANKIAPEHLQIIAKNPNQIAKQIKNAGLVLIGQNTPSAASDYLLGTNHILPTNRFGKSRGSLSVLDFVKIKTTVESSKPALKRIDRSLQALTKSENLPNHYEAVRSRL